MDARYKLNDCVDVDVGVGGAIRIVEVIFYWGLFDWKGGWTLSEGAWRRSAEMSAFELSNKLRPSSKFV